MRFPVSLLLISFIILTVSAGSPSSINTVVSMGGDGGVIASYQSEWNVGGVDGGFLGENNVQGGQIHHTAISGPGANTYTRNSTLDASTSNYADTATEFTWEGGGIYEEGANLYDMKIAIPPTDTSQGTGDNETDAGQTPSYQEINTRMTGMGDMGHYTADQVVDGINLTTDYRAEGGSGFFEVTVDSMAEAGSDPKSAKMDYRNRVSEKYKAVGNSTGSYYGSVSTKYRDMSRPLGFGDSQGMNNTTSYDGGSETVSNLGSAS